MVWYGMVWYSTVQYSTVQYSIVHHSMEARGSREPPSDKAALVTEH